MDLMLVSRPKLGKHLVFDGSLLHGAPAHEKMKPGTGATATDEGEAAQASPIRVTFLVNIWRDRRPASVHPLGEEIRRKLRRLPSPTFAPDGSFPMVPQKAASVHYEKEEDIPESLRERIELPFVTKGITWEDTMEEGDDEGGLVVMTFPPPPTQETVLVRFGPSLQAYLDYTGGDEGDFVENPKEEQRQSGYV